MRAERQSVETGSPWERRFGYDRVVALGDHAWVSGTTAASAAAGRDKVPEGAAEQAEIAFSNAIEALKNVGFSAEDVVRTRMFLTDLGDAERVGAVHARVFGEVRPAATLVCVSSLIDRRLKVEVELEAAKGSR